MLCVKSTAQSIKPGLQPTDDSLAIVRQFVRNARPILDSLTALHFARQRIRFLESQVKRREQQRDSLFSAYSDCATANTALTLDLFSSQDQLGRYRQKRRSDQVQLWLSRVLGAYLVYKKICPSCPP